MDLAAEVIGTFMVGCRIGGCLMLMPGFANARVPSRARLFLAVVLALAVAPIAIDSSTLAGASDARLVRMAFAETVTGAIIGFIGRLYLSALGFMATALSSFIGLNGLAHGIDSEEMAPTIATLITVFATLVLLSMDLHRFLMTTVVESYERVPLAVMPDRVAAMHLVAETFQASFLLSLQMIGPFVVYGVIVNLIFGIVGKLIPQIPSYFVSVPFMLLGGFLLLYASMGHLIGLFARAVMEALAQI